MGISLGKNFKKNILFWGLAFILIGVFLISFRFWFSIKNQQWRIDVIGTKYLVVPELQNMVLFLLRSHPEGVSKEDIEFSLLLNPRIKDVAVEIKGKKMTIHIQEELPSLLVHHPPHVLEFSQQQKLLQENFLANPHLLLPDLPIYFIAKDQKNKKEFTQYQRDIISLWGETHDSYGFIWQRISEIELQWQNEKPIFYVYLSKQNIRVSLKQKLSKEVLQRLWALFFYIEKISPSTLFKEIELYQRHAVLKKDRLI